MTKRPKPTSAEKASAKKQSIGEVVDPPEETALGINTEELGKAIEKFASARSPEARLQEKIDLEIAAVRKRSQH